MHNFLPFIKYLKNGKSESLSIFQVLNFEEDVSRTVPNGAGTRMLLVLIGSIGSDVGGNISSGVGRGFSGSICFRVDSDELGDIASNNIHGTGKMTWPDGSRNGG